MSYRAKTILLAGACLMLWAAPAGAQDGAGMAQVRTSTRGWVRTSTRGWVRTGLLPEAPTPQDASGTDAPGSSAQTGSSAQKPTRHASETERQRATRELKREEQQRILGIAPNFGTSYNWNAAPLRARQKMQLAFRSAVDPFTFAAAGVVAGAHEALNDEPGFGWGPAGYGKRAGAAYLDAAIGDMLGGGILPSLLHQDPRYFRMGHGSFGHRLLYSIGTTVMCRGDKSRHWQTNFSNIGGNILAGALSNLYYPAQNAGWGQTVGNGLIVTAEGAVGGIFNEFWPDLSRKFLHRDPSRGADVPPPPINPKSH